VGDGGTAWSDAGIAIAGIVFVTTVATVAIWQIFGTWRARMIVAREDAYRKLAEEASAAQQNIAADLAEVRDRVRAIERLLREVE